MPRYIIIAGVNGAGKSTFYHLLRDIQEMPRINTDEIVKEIGNWKNLSDVMQAGKIAVKKKRIAIRVREGGHGIPDSDVDRRYIESMQNVKTVLSQCDLAAFYDNTEAFRRFAIYKQGKLVKMSKHVPEWFLENIY